MLKGDCNNCIHKDLPVYSNTCMRCGISRKNYTPKTNRDRLRAMTDEELAKTGDKSMNIRACKGCKFFTKYFGNRDEFGRRTVSNYWCVAKGGFIKSFPKQCKWRAE